MSIPFLKLETIHVVRVVYKSGYTQDFEVLQFDVTGNDLRWITAGVTRPLMIGATEIAAVWKINSRTRIARK